MTEAPGSGGTEPRSLIHLGLLHAVSSGSSLLLFFLLILAGRYLGAADFGRFSFALAFTFLFDVLLDPGLYHYSIREMARHPSQAPNLLSHVLGWKLMAAPAVYLLALPVAGLLGHDTQTLNAVALMMAAHILRSFKEGLRAPLLALERFGADALSAGLERALLLGAGGAVLAAGLGLTALCKVFILVRLVDLAVLFVLVHHTIGAFKIRLQPALLRRIIFSAAPIGAFYITLNVYNYIDTIMLAALRSPAEVGWYGASYKIYEGFFLLPALLGTVLMPRLSISFLKNQKLFRRLAGLGIKYACMGGLMVGLNGWMLAGAVISSSFGQEYGPSVDSLRILMLGMPVVFALNLLQSVGITMDQQKRILWLALVGLGLNAGLNRVVIPLHGQVGAAAVTVLTELLIFAGLAVSLQRAMPGAIWHATWGRPLVAGALPACLAAWWMGSSPPSLAGVLVMNVALISGFLLGGGVGTAERRWLLGLLSNRTRRPR